MTAPTQSILTQGEGEPRFGILLSKQATYGALKRRVTHLRAKVSEYDAMTDEMKRKAERKGGPAARFAVDSARSPGFASLREELRKAEAEFASWKQPPRKVKRDDRPLSEIVKTAMRRPHSSAPAGDA